MHWEDKRILGCLVKGYTGIVFENAPCEYDVNQRRAEMATTLVMRLTVTVAT